VVENTSLHTFQTFWWGDALSPYEAFCLKSFIDHGHKIDLYTFDPNLSVPTGVSIRDASALISYDRFFTYESGAGKGSPAAFANLFRYRLLAEKGGWWIDTDVVCLSAAIPHFGQFFAQQDAEFVNNAILFFEAHHPAMIRCYARAEQLGSSVQWGDTGPQLLTQVLRDLGIIEQAHPPSSCYPVYYLEALDLLRPSESAAILERGKSSLFLHLWNEILRRNEIRKECLPPRGSVVRRLIEDHQVPGWTGEYDSETLERLLKLQKELTSYASKAEALQNQIAALDSERQRLQVDLGKCAAGNAALREDSEARLARQRSDQETAARLRGELGACSAELERSKKELLGRCTEINRQQSLINSIVKSTSWRWTAPMRAAVDQFRALRNLLFGKTDRL
jgi:hypothetical protein